MLTALLASTLTFAATPAPAGLFAGEAPHLEVRHRPWYRRPAPPPPPRYRRPPPPPPPPPVAVHHARPADTHDVSLTLSATHLTVPMAAATAEFSLGDRGGIGVTGGLGAYQGAMLVELGGELRGYAVGDFDRGLYLGVGARGTSVPFYQPTDLSAAGAVFVGGKYTFAVPITLDLQLGPQLVANDDALVLGPYIKAGVGVSF